MRYPISYGWYVVDTSTALIRGSGWATLAVSCRLALGATTSIFYCADESSRITRFVSFFVLSPGLGGFLDGLGGTERFEGLVEQDIAHGTFEKGHRNPPPEVRHFGAVEVSLLDPGIDETREELS